jgi:hypothetical protein
MDVESCDDKEEEGIVFHLGLFALEGPDAGRRVAATRRELVAAGGRVGGHNRIGGILIQQ